MTQETRIRALMELVDRKFPPIDGGLDIDEWIEIDNELRNLYYTEN